VTPSGAAELRLVYGPAAGNSYTGATMIGPLKGEVVDFDEVVGLGFISGEAGGPTYVFR
jgi:hypothetical protein